MVARVNGGILTSQVMKGRLRYFKMTASGTTVGGDGSAPFVHTISDGTVIIPGQTTGGRDTNPGPVMDIFYDMKVGPGQPVPDSVAERAFRKIMEKCVITQINIVSDTEIHFSVTDAENWETSTNNVPSRIEASAAQNMEAAVQLLGVQGEVLTGTDPLVIGQEYLITSWVDGDDFSTVGGPADVITPESNEGKSFVATATPLPGVTSKIIPVNKDYNNDNIPDTTKSGCTYDFANITIVEVPFELVP